MSRHVSTVEFVYTSLVFLGRSKHTLLVGLVLFKEVHLGFLQSLGLEHQLIGGSLVA